MADDTETLDIPPGQVDGKAPWEKDADFLNEGVDEGLEEIDKEDKEKEKKGKENKEDKIEGKEEGKEEGEEEGEEEEEDKGKVGPPIFRAIEKKFPEFFKSFPEVRQFIARDREYTKLFGSVDDAKVVAENYGVMVALENDLTMKGDPTSLVDSLYRTSQESRDPRVQAAAKSFASRIIPALYKQNSELFAVAMIPQIKAIVRDLAKEGKKLGLSEKGSDKAGPGDNYYRSAYWLATYALPDIKFDEILSGKGDEVVSDKPNPEQERLNRERSEFEQRKYDDFAEGAHTMARSLLTKRLEESISDEDYPDMTPFIRTTAINEIIDRVGKALDSDEVHLKAQKSLWLKARANNFQGDYRKEIVKSWFSAVKRIIDPIRRQVLAEVTKKSKSEKRETEREDKKPRSLPQGGHPREKKSSPKTDKNYYRDNSDLDIIKEGL